MTLYLNAEEIKIEGDEDGYSLLITEAEEGKQIRINIQGIVFEFYAAVQAEIRPYVLEAESARNAVAAGLSREQYLGITAPQLITNRPVSVEDAVEAGYALDDPKSPGFHERYTELD